MGGPRWLRWSLQSTEDRKFTTMKAAGPAYPGWLLSVDRNRSTGGGAPRPGPGPARKHPLGQAGEIAPSGWKELAEYEAVDEQAHRTRRHQGQERRRIDAAHPVREREAARQK